MFKHQYYGNDVTINEYLKSFCLSKQKIQTLFNLNSIKINNVICQSLNDIIKKHDIVVVDDKVLNVKKYKSIYYDLNVLYEDDYLLVIDKPANTLVYDPLDSVVSCANYVAGYFERSGIDIDIRHVHRLDYGTTGCLVYAKDILTHSKLSSDFENHLVKKEYLALVRGIILNTTRIDKKIGRNRHDAKKMIISNSGKDALTIVYPLKQVGNNTLVKVLIKHGRTHQIRVHLSSINHPLVGDVLYGDSKFDDLMLQCSSLTFTHPHTLEQLFIHCEMPNKFLEKR